MQIHFWSGRLTRYQANSQLRAHNPFEMMLAMMTWDVFSYLWYFGPLLLLLVQLQLQKNVCCWKWCVCVYPVAVISYKKYFLFTSLYRLVRTFGFSFSSLFINKTLKPNKQQLWNEFNSMKLLWMNGKLNNNFV